MATETTTRPTTFRTKYPELRLVRRQRDDIFDSRGDRKIGQRNRDTVVAEQEKENRDLLKAGVSDDKLIDIDRTPWEVQFTREGTFETDDPKLIEWLRSHPGYNSVGGPAAFWEDGAAPEEPEPRLGDQMKAIAAAGDVIELDRIEQSESDTHSRKMVFDAIEAARERMGAEDAPVSQETEPSTSPPSEPA